MNRFFAFITDSWLSGKAFSKIRKEQYKEAIELFNKLIKLRSNDKGIELDYYHLGYCYLQCNDHDNALLWFSKSYKTFQKNTETGLQIRPYQYLLSYYSHLLKKKGKTEQASQLDKEAKKIFGEDCG